MNTQHIHISSRRKIFDLKLKEVWQYRDLILLFTKKHLSVTYKQTVLGPLWLFINPLMSSIVYMLLFGRIAKLSTDGIPMLLFYLSGTAVWTFFSSCVSNNSSTFVSNAGLFGKVYFPRLTVPVSNVLTAGVCWCVQMLLVFAVLMYYAAKGMVHPNYALWPLLPLIMVQLGVLGLGCGIIVSSLTTKYRDLGVLVSVCVQFWMYATPVVYPLSELKGRILEGIILLNPVTMPMELFRYALLGVGTVYPAYYALSIAMTVLSAVFGVMIFNLVEKTFMDTV